MDITVITPFYKGNAYMEQLFHCIRANAMEAPSLSVELILVNDSPSVEIVYDKCWVQGFTLHILTNSQNSGIHRSRVNGLQHAQGTFILFLDQDDLIADNALSSQFSLMHNADVVVANGFDQNPRNYGPIYRSTRHQSLTVSPRFYYSVGNLIVSPGHCLIRKNAIPIEWYEHCIHRSGSDDLLLWLMMFARNCRFVTNPEMLYTHVDTGENVSANVDKMLSSSQAVLSTLKQLNLITAKQERQFLRSRSMARFYVGKNKLQKMGAMLRYPDVALERLVLQRYK